MWFIRTLPIGGKAKPQGQFQPSDLQKPRLESTRKSRPAPDSAECDQSAFRCDYQNVKRASSPVAFYFDRAKEETLTMGQAIAKDGRERPSYNWEICPPNKAASEMRENLIRRPPDEIFALVDLIG